MKSEFDFHPLLKEVEKAINSNMKIIGIDGLDGIGKTPLAKLLGAKLDAKIVSLDSYLEKNQNKYTNALNERLINDINNSTGITIIEGVCLLAAAKRFGFELDCLVYLKRMHLGIWVDEDICEFSETSDEIISKEEDKIFIFKEWNSNTKNLSPPNREDVKLSGLRCELIHYHDKYQPHNNAHLVLELENA